MANSFQSTIKALDAVFRDYRTKGDPEFLKLAPVVDSDANGNYLVYTDVARLDDANAPVRGADGADFLPANFDYDYVQYQVNRLIGFNFTLPYSVIDAIESGTGNVDVIDGAMARVTRPLFGKLVSEFVALAAAELAAPSAGGADISSGNEGFGYTNYMETAMQEVELATGMLPTHLYVDPTVARRMRLLDEVQSQTAISGFTDSGSAVRRTGMVTWDAVKAWHRDILGLELLIERESKKNTSGDGAYAAGTTGILAVSNPGVGEGAFKTFHRTNINDGAEVIGDLARVSVRENGAGKARGVGVDGDVFAKSFAVAPQLGRKIDFQV
jgi:hypothetical protein